MCTAEPLDVWVKLGAGGDRLAGDPAGQQLFLACLWKGASLRFSVKAVNELKPPPEFKMLGLRKAPALQHGEEVFAQIDEMLDYIEQVAPSPTLRYADAEAEDATSDLFRQFLFYIKDPNRSDEGLLGELLRVDRLLEQRPLGWLAKAGGPSQLDARVLPQLQAVRVAAKALRGFQIPVDLQHVWRYLARAYANDAFRQSAPCDQEIILHWAERPDTPEMPMKQRGVLARAPATFSFAVPTTCGDGETTSAALARQQ